MFQKMVMMDMPLFSSDFKDGLTPLHIATKYGRSKTVSVLLKRGAEVNRKDHVSNTQSYNSI